MVALNLLKRYDAAGAQEGLRAEWVQVNVGSTQFLKCKHESMKENSVLLRIFLFFLFL